MTDFDAASALLGGALIGLAAALLMLLLGRIAGVSGILAGAFDSVRGGGALAGTRDGAWRAAFVLGLVAVPLIANAVGFNVLPPQMPRSWSLIAVAGLLVGFGTRLGGGCTSGHGVCGMARLSLRSIAATMVFMVTAALVVAIMRHGIGG
jgi:uncharacterized membrane protein YedE/YeeE